MKFRRKPKLDNGINLTPLIDVVFLLLIFFMVTTSFNKQTRLVLKLPEAAGEPVVEQVYRLDLLISREGIYSLNGENLINSEIKTIMAALKDASGGDSGIPLSITADANATHQSVITALDAASQLGFEKLNINTQRSREQ
ncbi:MAG: biopolymer transporter ExbD [Porticoccaceae bacterium]|nr:biopolymer transporter ExbD [Porticoccaceae bacterium]MBT5577694.1 biopolymer transporter ExbD [Porticoccaceae bacterium]MBT7374743.1 biopolymer transporter ExbD [Porticoccaceae bacterium]